MGRLLWLSVCLAALIAGPSAKAQMPDQLHKMYDANQLFALRDSIQQNPSPLFYRAIVETSSNQIKAAKRDFLSVIHTAPHSNDAFDAHELLGNMYFRNGMYRQALQQFEIASQLRPNAKDLQNSIPLFKALAKSPNQSVAKRKPSKLRMRMEQGNLFVPLKLNGKEATYVFDTGAAFSVFSESEANRLGLPTSTVDTNLSESSGTDVKGARIAVVKNLVIGNLHLKNVPFIVLPDTQEPFIELPPGSRGILGLPVLLAMQTVRWEPTGSFEFAFPTHDLNLSDSNMLFKDTGPITQVACEGRPLVFTLDTGAIDTDLNPAFAKTFPDLLKASGHPESRKLTGMGGSNNYDAVLLPSVLFQVGGLDVTLKPAHVLVKHGLGTWAAGNLGMDLLNQARTITLNFQAMTLHLE